MTPARLASPAYWSSGGVVVGRCGPLTLRCALALFAFFGREALERHAAKDAAATARCVALAGDLAKALVATADWARAGAGVVEPKIAQLRDFTQRCSPRSYG